jgi:hypothetical protein
MPTASTTSPRTAKPATKRAGTRAKAASARATRVTAPPKNTATPRTTTRTASSNTAGFPERAVLIPLGAALIARDQLVASVNDAISSYSSPAKAQSQLNTQLNKFERRGITARNRLEREVRKTRTRVERELRQRRRDGSDLANRLQERVLNLV